MKVAIVGGGISGLYIAQLFADKHANSPSRKYEVTIFEGNMWGGDIKSDTVNGHEYPISTLFVMPHDELLMSECDKRGLRRIPYEGSRCPYLAITVIVTIAILVIFRNRYAFLFGVLLFIFLLSYVQSKVCYYTLAFGANPDCSTVSDSLIELAMGGNYKSTLSYIPDCGMVQLYRSMLHDKRIRYVNAPVTWVERRSTTSIVIYNGIQEEFDICVFACPYESYARITTLTDEEVRVLSTTKYFDFYSTLVIFRERASKITERELKSIPNYLGSFQVDDAYLIASQKPIEIPLTLAYTVLREYKWQMPYIQPLEPKKAINHTPHRRVFFTGKELAGNGVEYCMKHAKRLFELITA